jgi:predicted RNA-binding protein with PIN domain
LFSEYNACVADIVIIDGNNLLHAVRSLGPTRPPGRERLFKIIEHWAAQHGHEVTLIFDGPAPVGPFSGQMQSNRIELIFSGHRTADDCIVERLAGLRNPDRVQVVSDDGAIRHAARERRCRTVATTALIAALFPPGSKPMPKEETPPADEKPSHFEGEKDQWLEAFDDHAPEEPFDGFDAMQH